MRISTRNHFAAAIIHSTACDVTEIEIRSRRQGDVIITIFVVTGEQTKHEPRRGENGKYGTYFAYGERVRHHLDVDLGLAGGQIIGGTRPGQGSGTRQNVSALESHFRAQKHS